MFHDVTRTMSHPHQRPFQPRMRHGTERETDPPKPYHHGRFPGALRLLAADERWQGMCRMCLRLSPLPGLSAHPESDLHRRWVSDPPLPLCSDSIGRAHHLAYSVHRMQGGLYGVAPLRLALSLHESRCGAPSPARHPRWPQSRMVCDHLSHRHDVSLSLDVCLWPPQCSHGADPVWLTVADLYRVFPAHYGERRTISEGY